MATTAQLSGYRVARVAGLVPKPFDFEMALPADCRPEQPACEAESSTSAFGPTPMFQAGSRSRPFRVAVRVALLTSDVGASDFVAIDAEASGHTVVQGRDWPGTRGCQAEIITRQTVEGQNWLTRSRAVKDGVRVFRVDASAPEQEFERCERDCAQTVMSFRLLHAEQRPCAEGMATARIGLPIRRVVKFPDSWRETARSEGDGSCELELLRSFDDRLSASIQIGAYQKREGESAHGHLRDYSNRLKSRGYRLAGAPILSTEAPAGSLAAYQYAPLARAAQGDLCVGAMLLELRHANVLLGFQGPTREGYPWCWAMMRRTFEWVRESLLEG